MSEINPIKNKTVRSTLRFIAEKSGAGFPWFDIVAELWRWSRKLWQQLTDVGIYEVLNHEATLEIKDRKGRKAHLHKRQQVRYLQNNVIAYRDQAWGDGRALLNYRCSPGIEADRYKSAHVTYILISLRETKQRGEMDEFDIQWDAEEAFTHAKESWATEVSHRTKQMTLQIIFPKSRLPRRVEIHERYRRKVHKIDNDTFQKLADGRWLVEWSVDNPRIHERFLFEWEW
ncbi:MAG: hypothetical protein AAF614_41565 [Chloroflexota bacterium]